MSESRSILSLTRAQLLVCGDVPRVGMETVGLMSGLGRVIRRELVSKRDCPAADLADRDGFCLRARDGLGASERSPAEFEIKAPLNAGEEPLIRIGRGECVRIMNGAALAAGADAVVPSEEAQVRAVRLVITHPIRPGDHVRKTATAFHAGDTVARRGDIMTPDLMGLLATAGLRNARVSRSIRVGIMSTGDEIVDLRARPEPWQVHNSNALVIEALGHELGCEIVNLGISADLHRDIRAHLRAARQCDVVLLTGGTSTGARDLVLDALREHGCRIVIRGMRLRPGRHLIFARKGRQVLFGLPGRPWGCSALFHLIVRPAILAMAGSSRPLPASIRAVWCGGPVTRPAVDTLFAGKLESGSKVRPLGNELARFAGSDSLVLLKAGGDRLENGDQVDVFPRRLPLR
jgi:molybdopterin molybdotransferase